MFGWFNWDKFKGRNYGDPGQVMRYRAEKWMTHYYQYLASITYQLYEWEGLPPTIDPRYLEISLHTYGYVGFYKDPTIGYVVAQGSLSGTINNYNLNTRFRASTPTYQKEFGLYNYNIDKGEDTGVAIYNNDLHYPTIPSLEMFASDLADLKQIIYVNQNAQKTPVLLKTGDKDRKSVLKLYHEYEGNAPVIVSSREMSADVMEVMKTDAPYVVDKLNTQKDAVWNEAMTFLGINNANNQKRERMITDEATSNNQQIGASGNTMLKARQEACVKINELYGLNVSVKMRDSVLEEFGTEVNGKNGSGDDATKNDGGTV